MKFSTILPILWANCCLCMIIPEFDGIVRFIENIDGTRSVRAGEGLGQHDPGNFHTEHQHVAHKTEFLPYRYVIVFNEDISLQQIQSHMQVVQKDHSTSVGKLTEDDAFWRVISSSVSSKSQFGGIDNFFDINGLFRGYTGYFTDEIIKIISQDPIIKFVEQETTVKISNSSLQEEAPWGLHRVSHREKPKYGQDLEYLYEDAAGKGVTSYVLDTGIDTGCLYGT